MIGAKVTGYTLAVGDYVFVTLDGMGVQRVRIRALIAHAESGLTAEVIAADGRKWLVKPAVMFINPQEACNHAFGFAGGAEIPL